MNRLTAAVILFLSMSVALQAEVGDDFFEKKIRPVLATHCYECHSAAAGKAKGGLYLDTRAGIRKGGESGPAVVPENADEGTLLGALTHETFEMPPDKKLPQHIVDDFRKWIELGAPDPREGGVVPTVASGIDFDEAREFWAFQPPQAGATPEVQNRDWPLNDIDHYVLHELEKAGLAPASDASRRALIRRLSFDLTGLPPSPEQTQEFVDDESPLAVEHLVDRLLASPQFGEHWGRHWLDVARYADSNGGDINLTYPNAWRYRDYVINAFNNDKPFNEFVREQIAGDLLPATDDAQRAEQLIASGYLVVGPKMLSERDKEKLHMDVVDEQLDSIGKTFMGLTLGCARCHDHKFDPIPTHDYYALAGILRSTVTVEGIRMNNVNVSGWIERPLPIEPEHAKALEDHKTAVAETEKQIAELKKLLGTKSKEKGDVTVDSLVGIVLDNDNAELVGEWKSSSLTFPFVGAGYIHDNRESKGEKRATYRPQIETAGEYEVRISYSPGGGREKEVPVRIVHRDGTAELKLNQEEKPTLGGVFKVLGRFPFDAGMEGRVEIETTGTSNFVILDAVQFVPVEQLVESPELVFKEQQDPKLIEDVKEKREQLAALEKDLAELKKSAPPPAPMAMAASDREDVGDCEICIRGEPHNRGKAVPRGFLTIAPPTEPVSVSVETSGRVELANYLASESNPLTARVTVNRVWAHLFGNGLVGSVDNFGTLGERPSHPELLDHLAVQFMADNWSTKKLIRSIVLSRTYQLSTEFNAEAAEFDPDNRLLWRHSRRRLGAESIRDAMLQISGSLDLTPGGSAVSGLGETAVANNQGEKKGELKGDTGQRRTIYQPIIRNDLPDYLTIFNFADPEVCTGQRSETTVPAQALWMLNSEFVRQQAQRIAEALPSGEGVAPGEQVDQLYLQILGRPATTEETERARVFISEANSNQMDGWAQLAQAMLASSEFRFVD
ncbi:MAG: DUF1553 domain-containing protein [Planctomycetaceae bacterium]